MANAATPDPSGDNPRQPMPPAKRKRLQQCFEAGNQKVAQGDLDYASELFSQCVLGDPANLIYAQSFLGTLRQKYDNNKKGSKMAKLKGSGALRAAKKAASREDWPAVMKSGIEVLKLNPWDVGTLMVMAEAAGGLDGDEVQLAYMRAALDFNSLDVNINRQIAMELQARMLFDQAIACWSRILKAKPGDPEAGKAVADLTVERTIHHGKYESQDPKTAREAQAKTQQKTEQPKSQVPPERKLEQQIKAKPDDIGNYLELAKLYGKANKLRDAEDVLRRAAKIDAQNEHVAEQLDDVQLRRLQLQYDQAKEAFEKSRTEEMKQKVLDAKKQLGDKTLEIQKSRVQRTPNNPAFRFELAQAYHAAGQFKEAIGEYQKAKGDASRKGVSLLALGQCFFQVKQYRLAMNHYEQAIDAIVEPESDDKKKALYLSAKLAYALKDYDKAELRATDLAGLDFGYKDVSDLLDKIAEKREDTV